MPAASTKNKLQLSQRSWPLDNLKNAVQFVLCQQAHCTALTAEAELHATKYQSPALNAPNCHRKQQHTNSPRAFGPNVPSVSDNASSREAQNLGVTFHHHQAAHLIALYWLRQVCVRGGAAAEPHKNQPDPGRSCGKCQGCSLHCSWFPRADHRRLRRASQGPPAHHHGCPLGWSLVWPLPASRRPRRLVRSGLARLPASRPVSVVVLASLSVCRVIPSTIRPYIYTQHTTAPNSKACSTPTSSGMLCRE